MRGMTLQPLETTEVNKFAGGRETVEGGRNWELGEN